MLGHRQLGLEDYLEILRKRWWVILIPTILGCIGVFLGSLAVSDQFTSTTLVLVEQQKVPDSFVKPVDTEDIGERVGTMQQQILSRTRLQPIIEKFGLFKKEKGKVAMEDLVDELRKSIVVTPIQSLVTTKTGELPGFSISFTGDDPKLSQQVCSEILSMFIEENLHQSEARSVGTTDFMKDQLDQAKKGLDAQDAKLAEFKRRYIGSMPGNEQTDMTMMSAISSQLDAVTSQLNRAQQDKSYIDSLLAEQLAAWQLAQKGGSENGSLVGGAQQQDPLQKKLTDLQAQLVTLRSQYTDDHPDVVKLKADIAALKQKVADSAPPKENSAQAKAVAIATEPQAIQQLRFQSHQADVMIKDKTREQTRLRGQLSLAQGRLSMSPGVEQQYKEITRDYQTALAFYNDLLTKKNQAEMATSLERAQQGEQFTVMDPPNLPEKPSFPNRPQLAGAGLAGGLVLGFGITLLLEMSDKSLHTENDVEQFLGLPTLAMIPLLGDGEGKKGGTGKPIKGEGAQLPEPAHV
ncbi:MAG TPA: Wzz/FepE/Etk N-terminal domain-containing protein [Terriglobia bacterium]|nr:Wzz/FepE/Etk N-terminal domain-containing protein [Terriglobia bacterium]